MQQDSFSDLIQQATEMLLDRPKEESDLIYHVAKMDQDLRSAIIIAYEMIYKSYDDFR